MFISQLRSTFYDLFHNAFIRPTESNDTVLSKLTRRNVEGMGDRLHFNLFPHTSLGLRKTMKTLRKCHVLSTATAVTTV
jgi:hypothetical protein